MACLTCKEFIEFLDDYAAGAQEEAVRAEFERHMADCPACAEYLREYLETIRLAKCCCETRARDARERAPEGLVRAILAARKKGE
jgi:anti-sigma factor RsiW